MRNRVVRRSTRTTYGMERLVPSTTCGLRISLMATNPRLRSRRWQRLGTQRPACVIGPGRCLAAAPTTTRSTDFAAGATHICIQPVHEEGDFTERDRILALADT